MQSNSELVDFIEAETVPELFLERTRKSSDCIAFTEYNRAEERWEDFTWAEVSRRVAQWRAGFLASGLDTGDRVAVLLQNCLEWVCFDQAALGLGLVVVPLYTSDSPENWAHMLSDCSPRFLLVETEEQWRGLRPLRDRFSTLGCVASVERPAGDATDLLPLDDWLPNIEAPAKSNVGASTLATITYTSGTTGRPKGVMLTHGNMMFAVQATHKRNPGRIDDVFLSILPMAHIFARTVEYYLAMAAGSRIVFARSIANLAEDFPRIKPTVLIGVPRIYERVWRVIEERASQSLLGRLLLRRALVLGSRPATSMVERLERCLIDHYLVGRVSGFFGGRLRLAVSGSAPLPAAIAKGLLAVRIPIVEGYGLAEAAGPVSGDEVFDYVPGSVGRPLDGIKIRISNDGELLVLAPSVMQAYWERPDDTKRTIDQDGWLHTGDLATIRDHRLFILGRAHDTIITATAEKIAPLDLENCMVADPLFEQALVVGDGRPFLVAIVVLDPAGWEQLALENKLDPNHLDDDVTEQLLIDKVSKLLVDFPSYAQIRRIYATLDAWTLEEGLLTVTMKTKRKAVESRYLAIIDRLYEGH